MVVCSFCKKSEENDSMMQRCGGCQTSNYCSRACQVKHWKEHRPVCRNTQQCKKDTVAKDGQRQLRLFLSWKEKVPVLDLFIHHYGIPRLNDMRHEKVAIFLTVEFDYNKQIFVPPHPPCLIPLSVFIQKNPQYAAAVTPKGILTAIRYKDFQHLAELPFTAELDYNPHISRGSSWGEIVEEMFPHNIAMLTSSIFASWDLIQKQNVEKQLHMVRQSPHYRHFIVTALRIKTLQPRHKTHIIMIHLKMGLGLGQIVALPKYEVLTFQEVKDKLQERVGPTVACQCCQDWLNLETHPELLKAKATDPNIVRLPILFDIPSGTKMEPILFRIPNNVVMLDVMSQSAADAMANEKFAELKKTSFPYIRSPELH